MKSQGKINLLWVLPVPLKDLRSSFTSLQHCAPLGGPLLSSLATPPIFFSVTPSKLSKENAHFLCTEQSSLLLGLVVPQYNITIQKRLT